MLASYEGMLVALCHIVNNNSTTTATATSASTIDYSMNNMLSQLQSSDKSKVSLGTPIVRNGGDNMTVMEQVQNILSFITPIYTTRILTELATSSSNGGSSGDIQKQNDKMYTCLLSWARSISMLRLIFPASASSSYHTLFQPLFAALLLPLKGFCLNRPSLTPTLTPLPGGRALSIAGEENIPSNSSQSPFSRLSHWIDTDNRAAVWVSLLTHLLQTCSSPSSAATSTASVNTTTATTSGTGRQHSLDGAEVYWAEFASLSPTIQHQCIIQWMITLHRQSNADNNVAITSTSEQFEQYMIQYITLFESINNRLPCPIFRPGEGLMTSSLLEYMHVTSSTIGTLIYSYSYISLSL